jgi:hypothetical protein
MTVNRQNGCFVPFYTMVVSPSMFSNSRFILLCFFAIRDRLLYASLRVMRVLRVMPVMRVMRVFHCFSSLNAFYSMLVYKWSNNISLIHNQYILLFPYK